jgi:ribonuclease HII
MALLVGIDEAGFGPLLGPLVVSSASFSMPDDLVEADLWEVLRRSVAKQRKGARRRLHVADSKQVYTRKGGIEPLERSVLSILRAAGCVPKTVQEIIQWLDPACLDRLKAYPWHQDLTEIRLPSDDPAKAITASVFARDLADQRMAIAAIRSRCVDVGYYNHLIETIRNKSTVLFSISCSLLKEAFDRSDDERVEVVVDRQGGRMHYRIGLQTMFEGFDMAVLNETDQVSTYRLIGRGRAGQASRQMRVHFLVGADGQSPPVSLASMVSKYVRELLVEGMNRYFGGLCQDLKPTAGYWQDGLRFIEDIKSRRPDVQIDERLFIRSR